MPPIPPFRGTRNNHLSKFFDKIAWLTPSEPNREQQMPKPNEPSPGDVAAPAGQTNAIKIQHIMRFSIVLYIYRILCAIYRIEMI